MLDFNRGAIKVAATLSELHVFMISVHAYLDNEAPITVGVPLGLLHPELFWAPRKGTPVPIYQSIHLMAL